MAKTMSQLRCWSPEHTPHEITVPALPCKLCGGALQEDYYDAFSTDSSFDYVGCSGCDVAFIDEDKVTQGVIDRWNKLMGSK